MTEVKAIALMRIGQLFDDLAPHVFAIAEAGLKHDGGPLPLSREKGDCRGSRLKSAVSWNGGTGRRKRERGCIDCYERILLGAHTIPEIGLGEYA
jgi:hypothetical protein